MRDNHDRRSGNTQQSKGDGTSIPSEGAIKDIIQGLLFNVEVEAQSDLNNGAISENLRREFKANNISLSGDAAASTEEADARWLIADGNKTYIVKKDKDKLNIYIQGGCNTEKLVKCAEKIGGKLFDDKLTSNQIRSFFGEVKQIEGHVRERGAVDTRRLVLLKPRLAYQARRHGGGVATLEKVLSPAISHVGDNVDYFQNFVDFFEAILAYFKAWGGK